MSKKSLPILRTIVASVFYLAAGLSSAETRLPEPKATVQSAPGLISGFDDVLRQSEVQNLSHAAQRLFVPSEGFAGMPLLYKNLSPEGFTIVSGITTWYTDNAEEFLKKEKFPTFKLRFRNWLWQWSSENFKMKEIAKILSPDPNKKFIFILDNSDTSVEIAKRLQSEHTSQIAATYLRQTVQSPAPDGTQTFITAFDIASAEYKAKRFTASQANAVAEVILKEKNFERIIPQFAFCPTSYTPCVEAAYELQRKCNAVAKRVSDGCLRREKALAEITAADVSSPKRPHHSPAAPLVPAEIQVANSRR